MQNSDTTCRRGLTRRELAGAGLAASAVLAAPERAHARTGRRPRTPALILVNGEVHTMDRRFRIHEALAIRDGVVVETGSTREIRRLWPAHHGDRPRGQRRLPGINDSHVHGLAAGVSLPPLGLDVNFPTVESIADVVDAVRAQARRATPGEWIRGSGWNAALLAELRADPTRQPTRQDLDAAAPANPVVLRDFSFHAVWVNSRALEAAGITRTTPDPPGGAIVRDATGEPTGVLLEAAQELILAALPALTAGQRRTGLRTAIGVLLSQGITSYTDPGLTPDEVGVYRAVLENGDLHSRVTLMLSSSAGSLTVGGTSGGSVAKLEQVLERYPRPRIFDPRLLQLTGVKIFADGIPPNHTAWVHDPYDDTGGTGGLVLAGGDDTERVRELEGIVRRAHRAGFQVGTHATGDRAGDAVVAAYVAAVRGRRGPRDPRHYVIHADLVTDAALRLLARHGMGVNMNPAIKAAIADAMLAVLGRERAFRQWPMRSALRSGATLTSASDWPVGVPDWRAGVVAAVQRRDLISGDVSGPEERLGIRQALRTYTSAPAYQDHAARWKGRLVPGMVADVCVLDGRVPTRRGDVGALAERQVALTLFGGRVRYERGPSGQGARTLLAAAGGPARCGHDRHCCCTRAPELLAGRG